MRILFSIITCALLACCAIHSPQAGPVGFRLPARSAFLPSSISGLKVWLDVTDSTSVTVATGASQINDLSGNGNHATQATASNQPAYTSGQYITLDGVDDWMEIPALGAINSGARSYVFQVRFSVSQLGGILTMRSAGGGRQFSAYVSNASASGNGLRRIAFTTGSLAGNQVAAETADSDTGWHSAAVVRAGNTSMKLYIDGALVATNSTNVGDVDIDFKTFLGTYADGNTPAGGLFFNGDVQKVLIYTSELSLTDVQTLYANGY